jgi:hypothetical protein
MPKPSWERELGSYRAAPQATLPTLCAGAHRVTRVGERVSNPNPLVHRVLTKGQLQDKTQTLEEMAVKLFALVLSVGASSGPTRRHYL